MVENFKKKVEGSRRKLKNIRVAIKISKTEEYDIEFWKLKGTKLITTHTNKENIHNTPTIILKHKIIYHSGRPDWCVIQSCDMLTEREGSCQASSDQSYQS